MNSATATLNEKMTSFLEEPRFAVLATINRDGTTQQSVMWYELRGDAIVMNTARGRLKERNLARNARASFIVEDGYRFFRAEGEVAMVDDPAIAQQDIRLLAIRYHGARRGEALARDTFSKQQRITLRLRIRRVYAPGLE